jgi:flagellar biosynthetic protein FliP
VLGLSHTLLAAATTGAGPSVTLNLGKGLAKPSQDVVILIAVTLLAIAPSLLIMLTGFVRMVIVLGMTSNALGLNSIPPGQVITGLALIFSLFIMAPTRSPMHTVAAQPSLHGKIHITQAFDRGEVPLKNWMLRQTDTGELQLAESVAHQHPAKPTDVSIVTLIPAFLLSQLKSAFIMGFVIFIPFLIIDLLVSSTLMSMGIMMLPPTLVSLPFKILLFVMVDGWTLVVHSLLLSFR